MQRASVFNHRLWRRSPSEAAQHAHRLRPLMHGVDIFNAQSACRLQLLNRLRVLALLQEDARHDDPVNQALWAQLNCAGQALVRGVQ